MKWWVELTRVRTHSIQRSGRRQFGEHSNVITVTAQKTEKHDNYIKKKKSKLQKQTCICWITLSQKTRPVHWSAYFTATNESFQQNICMKKNKTATFRQLSDRTSLCSQVVDLFQQFHVVQQRYESHEVRIRNQLCLATSCNLHTLKHTLLKSNCYTSVATFVFGIEAILENTHIQVSLKNIDTL